MTGRTSAEARVSEALQLAITALEGALRGKVSDAVLLRVEGECSYADYILILEGRSDRQVAAISDRILDALEEQHIRPQGIEGRGGGWVLLDLESVVVHVFRRDLREFYDLEGLWAHVPREDLSAYADRLSGPETDDDLDDY